MGLFMVTNLLTYASVMAIAAHKITTIPNNARILFCDLGNMAFNAKNTDDSNVIAVQMVASADAGTNINLNMEHIINPTETAIDAVRDNSETVGGVPHNFPLGIDINNVNIHTTVKISRYFAM